MQDIVLDEKTKLESQLPIKIGVIVYASVGQDDPIQVISVVSSHQHPLTTIVLSFSSKNWQSLL
jgi:hypothetical protein